MRYIGSKARILGFISETINQTFGPLKGAVAADLFTGTCCVAEMFKAQGAQVITNDYLRFSYALQVAKVKLNAEPASRILYEEALAELNALEGIEGFFFEEYTLEGTAGAPYARNYFSSGNAKKIDAVCTCLAQWRSRGDISSDMFHLLSASLVDTVTKVSNISGTYGAFLKIDDHRKFKPLELRPFTFADNGFENLAYCQDIMDLMEDVTGDLLYLDPPYNSRQYPPYYHILETAVLYDAPPIYGLRGRRPYKDQLSPFCIKEKALPALLDVVRRARFPHIYISYSMDGIIDYQELCKGLSSMGTVQSYFKPHRRFKSNNGGEGGGPVKEIIIYVQKR